MGANNRLTARPLLHAVEHFGYMLNDTGVERDFRLF